MTKGKGTPASRKSTTASKAKPQPGLGPAPAPSVHIASQTDESDPALSKQSNFIALMQAVTTCQSTLTGKIESVQLDISLIRRDMDSFRARLAVAVRCVGDSEDTLRDHSASLCTLQTRVKLLENKAEDAENCNRRNNLRIVGLPEGVEGSDPPAFTEHLLRTLLPHAQFSPFFIMERAHRMPATWGIRGAPLRTFILRLLNFGDWDQVLREARKIAALNYEGVRLMIFLDYSVDTQKLR